MAEPSSVVLTGRWLVVAPAGADLAEPVARALSERGAETVAWALDAAAATDRSAVAVSAHPRAAAPAPVPALRR